MATINDIFPSILMGISGALMVTFAFASGGVSAGGNLQTTSVFELACRGEAGASLFTVDCSGLPNP